MMDIVARLIPITILIMAFSPLGEAIKDESLVLYFPFDEGKGDTTENQSEKLNTGNLKGGATWTKDGKYKSAISFNGVDAYVLVDDLGFKTVGEEGDSYTVEAWIKTSQAGGQTWGAPIIIEKRGLASRFRVFTLYINSKSSISVHFEQPVERVEAPSPVINDKEWRHICFIRDGENVNLYVDGEPATTGKIADNDKSAPDEPVTIGCRRMDGGNTTHYFNGAIDEVAIYSRGLKEAEIKQDMKGVAAAVSHAGKLTTTWANIKMGF